MWSKTKEKQKKDNKLHFYQIIQSQSKPHFVTNTFNEVIAMAEDDSYTPEQKLNNIKNFAVLLSEYYGYLSYSDDSLISLEEEIELIDKYIQIEKVANPELTVNIMYDKEEIKNSGIQIPPLIIQPLVNNAVKYSNVTNMNGEGQINVIIKTTKDGCLIVVDDNGNGFIEPEKNGRRHTGIVNTSERLKGCNGTLRVINKTDIGGSGTRCEVTLHKVES